MRLFFVALTATAVLGGCFSPHTERVTDVDPYGWSPEDTLWVEYVNTDTLAARDLSFIIRYNALNRNAKLELTVASQGPDSISFAENVSLDLNCPAIEASDHFEAVVPYRTGCVLQKKGTYRFGFSPLEHYKGITAIGIKQD